MKRMTLALLLCLGVGLPADAPGAVFSVDNVLDDPNTADCGQAGFCTLRRAILDANVNGEPDTILLPAATYQLQIAGDLEDAAVTGDLDIADDAVDPDTPDVEIVGAGSSSTIIDGDDLDRIFDLQPGTSLRLTSVTVQNGRTNTERGGGIRAADPNTVVTLIDSVVTENVADEGGGVFTGGRLVVTNSDFIHNIALDTGGGIRMVPGSDVWLSGVELRTNVAPQPGLGGGGIYNDAGRLTILGCVFFNNQAQYGAGIRSLNGSGQTSGSPDVVVQDTEITDGLTSGPGRGGGIMTGAIAALGDPQGLYLLRRVLVERNSASQGGGGLRAGGGIWIVEHSTVRDNTSISGSGAGAYFDQGTDVTFDDTLLELNSSNGGFGGGVRVLDSSLSVVNGSEIRGNSAGVAGGGVSVSGGSSVVEILDSTVADNSAAGGNGGGGVRIDDANIVTIRRSTISGNTATGSGGGLRLGTSSGRVFLTSSTVAGNTAASEGGGLFDESLSLGIDTHIVNVTFAYNVATADASDNLRVEPGAGAAWLNTIFAVDPNDPLQDANCSIAGTFQSSGRSVATDATCNSNPGVGDIEADFDELDLDLTLADNGGPYATETLALLPNPTSVAIDAAFQAGCAGAAPLDTDQRLADLVNGCDIGAFEFAGPQLPDGDSDFLPDVIDNCEFTANPDQFDDGGLTLDVPPRPGLGDGAGNACQCGDADNDGLVGVTDPTTIRNALADPVGMALTAPGSDKCTVIGAAGSCDILDAVVIARAVQDRPDPGITPSCTAANP